MPIPSESIEVGKCYLVDTGRAQWVCPVTHITSDGMVWVEQRPAARVRVFIWGGNATYLSSFASTAVREVASEWTPDLDSNWQEMG